MAELTLQSVRKEFGESVVLEGASFEVGDGEFVVIVGPSGCGKSTLLRCIAGLEPLSGGAILIDGEDVTSLPPKARGVAMVFQSYALYPHMTVRQNIAFPLTLTGRAKGSITSRVAEVADLLGVTDLLDRRPGELSGGQRQRVAIGRAMAREPRLFLLDEPLSNLDAALRGRMRMEFARLHALTPTTTVYVTHDQVEAMTLADRIIVMRAGVIEQIGTPDELYHRPANRFVAGFIGSPAMNFIESKVISVEAGVARLEPATGGEIAIAAAPALAPGQSISVGVRPEGLAVVPSDSSEDLRIGLVERLGASALYHLEHPALPEPIRWASANRPELIRGQPMKLDLGQSAPLAFGADGHTIQS